MGSILETETTLNAGEKLTQRTNRLDLSNQLMWWSPLQLISEKLANVVLYSIICSLVEIKIWVGRLQFSVLDIHTGWWPDVLDTLPHTARFAPETGPLMS